MQKYYFWVVAHNGENDVLDGPFKERGEAIKECSKLNCPYDIYEWPTSDRGRATQIYKREKFQKGGDLNRSLERVKHDLPTEEVPEFV